MPTTINARKIIETCRKAVELREEGKYQESIAVCDKALSAYGPKHKALRDVLWAKAITLDVSGKANEALPIITELTAQYPMNGFYQNSLAIILNHCNSLAASVHDENELSPLLRNYWILMREFNSSGLWLTEAVAMLDIHEGKPLDAKQKLSDLLELSPRDAAYLLAAIRVATVLRDEPWLHQLRKQAASVAAERPDLEELSKQFVVKEQVALRN